MSGSMRPVCVEGDGDIGGVDGNDVSSLITCTEYLGLWWRCAANPPFVTSSNVETE